MYSRLFFFILLCLINRLSARETRAHENDIGDIFSGIVNQTNNFDLTMFNPLMKAIRASNATSPHTDIDETIKNITEEVQKKSDYVSRNRLKRSATDSPTTMLSTATEDYANVTAGTGVTLKNRNLLDFLDKDFMGFEGK